MKVIQCTVPSGIQNFLLLMSYQRIAKLLVDLMAQTKEHFENNFSHPQNPLPKHF